MFGKKRMNRQSGFTLLEVVIALFIFAILAITVSFGFHQIITINNRVQQQMRRWNRVVLAISMMQSDLNQMIKRPVQNGDGQQMPYFVNNTTAIKFTTDTFSPLNAKGHSDLERVSYVYSDGSLNKITWPVLDRARQTKQLSKTLLNGLDF